MPTRWLRPISALTMYLSPFVPLTGCADLADTYVERQEKRFAVTGKPEIALSTVDGTIELRSWNRPEVLIVIEKRAPDKQAADEIQVQAEQHGNRIVLEVKPARSGGVFGYFAASARLIVSLPEVSDVQASSGDGHIHAEQLSGTIDLRTGDGAIRARKLSGAVSAHSGDGAIDLDGVDGSVDVAAADGSIRLNGKLTRVQARTGDGSVRIRAAPGSSPSADWEIDTGDGSITLEVPEGFGAELDAQSGDGRVHVEGMTLSGAVRMERNAAFGHIGSGGRAVHVRTGDGSTVVRQY